MFRFPALLLSRGPNKQDPPRKHRGPLLNMFNFRDDTDFVFKPEDEGGRVEEGRGLERVGKRKRKCLLGI